MPIGTTLTLILQQDNIGSRVMSPAAGYRFANGLKNLSVISGSEDMLNIFKLSETAYYASLTKGYK